MSDQETPNTKKTPIWVWVLVAFFGLAGLGSIVGSDDESSSVSPAPAAVEEEPESEPEPAEPVVPESFASADELSAAIEAEFGARTNMDEARNFEISVAEDGWLNVVPSFHSLSGV